jgi:RNA-directed DNA polymerase
MRTTDTAAAAQAWSGAVTGLIGTSLRPGDVDSETSTPPTPGIRTSTTATRTTTTRGLRGAFAPSADPDLFHQLVQAYLHCRATKRNTASALAFEANLEANLCALHDQLIDGSYQPGPSICFVITHPKPREVWAAAFTDRVVHHLLYNRIAPRFHAAFTADSCACIPGRGTLYAARRLEHQIRSATQNWQHPAHYLKCDLANFFVSIDKRVLLNQLARRVSEPWWLRLTETVLMHDPRANVQVRGQRELLRLVPSHKSLFNAPDHHGLPIGNLSSQFFANVLLNDLDQRIKHHHRAPHYVRYVDDFVLVHPSPQWLTNVHADAAAWLPARLHLRLNDSKTIIQPVDRGVDFAGQVIKPWTRRTRARVVDRAVQRVLDLPKSELRDTANSYLGLLNQASHSHHDRTRIGNALRRRGKAINQAITRTFK